MALALEKVSPQGVVQREAIELGRNRFAAEPGFKYRIVDDAGDAKRIDATARRVGDELIVEELPDQTIVEFEGFFSRCTPEQSCSLSMEELGGELRAEITPASQPVAAMADGSFLMSAAPIASSITPMAAEGASMGVKIGGLVLVGVGLAAAGSGGGGGGGGGGDSAGATVTQSVSFTSDAVSKEPTPLISGKASSNARLAISVSGPTITTVIYNITADADGNWTLNLGTAVPTSAATIPATGLPAGDYLVTVRSVENNAAADVNRALRIDTTTDVPTIDAVGVDNLINATEKAAGVMVTGTAEPQSTVTITWGAASRTVTAGADGAWSTTFAASEVPADGATQVVASAVDSLGNPAASASHSVVIATSSPGVLISDNSGSGITNRPVTFTFSFSEAVDGFDASDIIVTGGTAGTLTRESATRYTLTVTPSANAAGDTISVAIPAGAATNANGNPLTASEVRRVAIDTATPTLEITDNLSGATTNGDVVFTFRFNEPVSGFNSDDVNVTGGTKGMFTAVSSTQYTLVVTPPPGQTGTITANVLAGRFTDAAGNPNASSTSHSQNYDTLAPVLTITDSTTGTATGPVRYSFSFSEPVSDFDLSKIAIGGGTAAAADFSGSGTSYQLVVTPLPNSTAPITVNVGANTVHDAAGNGIAAVSAAEQLVSAPTPPQAGSTPQPSANTATPAPLTVLIDDNTSDAVTKDPITFTFAFSQNVTGFNSADLAVTNGIPRAVTGDGANYSVVVDPIAGLNGSDVTVAILGNSVQAGSAAFPLATTPTHAQTVDNVAPVHTAPTAVVTSSSVTLTLSSVLDSGPNTTESVLRLSRTGGSPTATSALTWDPLSQSAVDTTVSSGQQYTYSMTITDLAGNLTTLTTGPIPVP